MSSSVEEAHLALRCEINEIAASKNYLDQEHYDKLFKACEKVYQIPRGLNYPVLIIATGGTLSCAPDSQQLLRPMPPGELLTKLQQNIPLFKHCPLSSLDDASVNSKFVLLGFAKPLDSTMMQLADWNLLAAVLYTHLSSGSYRGAVIIHGTDTLAYTAGALSFQTNRLPFPVVVTGSQVPLVSKETDAISNLEVACRFVLYNSHQTTGRYAGIFVAFSNQIFWGSRVRKIHTTEHEAFTSPNLPALASYKDGTWTLDPNLPKLAFIRVSRTKALPTEVPYRETVPQEGDTVVEATQNIVEETASKEGDLAAEATPNVAVKAPEVASSATDFDSDDLPENLRTVWDPNCRGCYKHPRLHLVHPGTRIKVITLTPAWENDLFIHEYDQSVPLEKRWEDCEDQNSRDTFARNYFGSYSGILVQAYGSGNVPEPLLELLKIAKSMIPVGYLVQPIRGGSSAVYGVSVQQEHGAILNDITLEAALPKMCCLIGESRTNLLIHKKMPRCHKLEWLYALLQKGIDGEMTHQPTAPVASSSS